MLGETIKKINSINVIWIICQSPSLTSQLTYLEAVYRNKLQIKIVNGIVYLCYKSKKNTK